MVTRAAVAVAVKSSQVSARSVTLTIWFLLEP